MDIVFVLDESFSEGQNNFNKQLDFVKNVTKQFKVGPDDTLFSVVTFSTTYHNEFYLNRYSSQATLQAGLNRITYRLKTASPLIC